MKTVGLAAAACALLAVVTGCGSGPSATATPAAGGDLARANTSLRGGEARPLGKGLTLTASAPKPFVPTSGAFPVVSRAVGFEMTVQNDGTAPYAPTLLSLTASTDDGGTKQVIDSAQGYTGVISDDSVQPGRTVHFQVAFAVPTAKTELVITAQPDPAGTEAVIVFDGQV
ncbi:hypothetical protein [Actinokineospora inagensis]|uniref:hypothetical protein n=1 Tax=Actinokineospora inagensis TaxID=103730 RepID=UPI0004097EC9|nr:hypothetical protein [Actinokineospora inagensis]